MALKDIYKYSSINIVFDEVELYFHPDMQRKYINSLYERIKTLNIDSEINNLNVIFVTHSPFILSDIPNINVLKLQNGDPQKYLLSEQTFGANVHDLLANDFFMGNGFMGEWAKLKISDTINFLHYRIYQNEVNKMNEGKLPYDNKMAKKAGEYEKLTKNFDQKFHQNLIKVVGEPLIKNSLEDLYKQAFPLQSKSEIQLEIERLTELRDNMS